MTSTVQPTKTGRRSTSGPPIDPRLLKYSSASRRYVGLTVVMAVIQVIAVIVTAAMVASILSELIVSPSLRSLDAQAWHLTTLAAAILIRVGAVYLHDRYAHRASTRVIAELRDAALTAVSDPARTSPRELLRARDRLATTLTRGLEAVGPYLTGYVPALILSVIMIPVLVVVMAWADLTSAVIVVITLPLIPIFMILIGLMTRERTADRLDAMSRLSSQLLDLIAGIPTLRALGRERDPAARVEELGQAHRRSTMQALRVAFLSGAILEFLATLSVALVAVSIGLRLVFGEMGLYGAVFALILAPEVYLPLRTAGAQFHNSEAGVASAREIFAIIEDEKTRMAPATRSVAVAGAVISVVGLGVHGRDGWAPHDLTATITPGLVTVLTGPNGSGKSTLLAAMLGLQTPDEGSVLIGSVPVTELDRQALWEQVAWLPQHPVLVPGTVAENFELLGPVGDPEREAACRVSGFDSVLDDVPDGWQTRLGTGGVGLSAGQRQRLALARVLSSPAPLLLLDEPTTHLDPASEAAVARALQARARSGDTVVVVAHRPAMIAIGDDIIDVAEVRRA
ncbi:thiol reductant ABC exporter subunit CydD [Williamsia sp. 1135]|uniref:thiol reductant ABC exporter subunit CydD n=1 Tax=Williamsia sp. 1135 TaxID=1889262 RepID=UPI000A122E6A|nr:thiol reductant ABC exporter subunit CydD [Williamsia sp. 1135]ORM30526.1 thiol reductant ABC exporter subunit CydD [Williamsia sp. 1135]